jgi:hypothetical protein
LLLLFSSPYLTVTICVQGIKGLSNLLTSNQSRHRCATLLDVPLCQCQKCITSRRKIKRSYHKGSWVRICGVTPRIGEATGLWMHRHENPGAAMRVLYADSHFEEGTPSTNLRGFIVMKTFEVYENVASFQTSEISKERKLKMCP